MSSCVARQSVGGVGALQKININFFYYHYDTCQEVLNMDVGPTDILYTRDMVD